MSKLAPLALLAFAALACRTSMNKRQDANPEAGLTNASPDVLNAPDLPRPDSNGADTGTEGVPKAFRIENRTVRTVYMKREYHLVGRSLSASGAPDCTYYHSCSLLCPLVQDKQACCVACEQDAMLYEIPAGQSRSIPWDGHIFVKQTGPCSQCQCDQPLAATDGWFVVSADFYPAYRCLPSGCQSRADGTIEMALPTGDVSTTTMGFRIPSSNEEVIIIAGPDGRSTPDALPDGKPAMDSPPDSPASDMARDVVADTSGALLAEVSGHPFQIAAADALPDASLYGRSCATSKPGAVYRLTFSEDGAKVTIVRTDPVQETVLNGTLRTNSATRLGYDLDHTTAGGELSIRRDGDNLIGQLVLFGSGVPVIWCVESPMRPI